MSKRNGTKTHKERLAELLARAPVVVVDWDGTCVPQAWPKRPKEWLPGAQEGLRAFQAHGFEVRIHSTRCHELDIDECSPNPGRDEEIAYIRDMLDKAGFEDVKIISDSKPAGVAYVDDKGIRFTGDWQAVVRQVTGQKEILPFGPEWRQTDPQTGGTKGRKQAVFANMSLVADVYEARVHGFGVQKYPDEAGAPNWSRGMPWSWFYDALRRHIACFWAGEDINPESGLPHLAHARWMISNLIEYGEFGLGTDDRPTWRREAVSG